MAPEVTTVADDEVVVFAGPVMRRYDGLVPGTVHDLDGIEVCTLPRPAGELLCRFATVNDLHFGEIECGEIEGIELGPILTAAPGETPYPEVMNAAAVEEISAIGPAAVIAKGDLTTTGALTEYRRFLDVYGSAFGERLHHVLGNHDSPLARDGTAPQAAAPRLVELPGVRLALLDTVMPGSAGGRLDVTQLSWLDDTAADADAAGMPVVVLGHHHPWDPGAAQRPPDYFGINPDDSERLVEVVARRPSIVGYLAGHTHRNRVRRFDAAGGVPWVEVACVKDFPGTWAEYRVFEGGVLQVHRRLAAPGALAWSERCRALFGGAYPAYAFGTVDDRCLELSRN
ncbi:MAG: metallophosphoesterase family protein [Acidimicrobiales bacterium]